MPQVCSGLTVSSSSRSSARWRGGVRSSSARKNRAWSAAVTRAPAQWPSIAKWRMPAARASARIGPSPTLRVDGVGRRVVGQPDHVAQALALGGGRGRAAAVGLAQEGHQHHRLAQAGRGEGAVHAHAGHGAAAVGHRERDLAPARRGVAGGGAQRGRAREDQPGGRRQRRVDAQARVGLGRRGPRQVAPAGAGRGRRPICEVPGSAGTAASGGHGDERDAAHGPGHATPGAPASPAGLAPGVRLQA